MSIFEPSRSPWTGRMLSIVRIVAGLVFVVTGTMKLFGFPPFPAQVPAMPVVPPMWEFHLAGILETYLGAAFTLGFLTRPIAFVLAGEMAVAYFQVSFPMSFWPTANWGTSAILYCFLFLYFMLAGAGPWSVDAIIAGRKAVTRID
ncbi:MAG: DoxX family protein [Gemmatimonadetes bacterium]|nr:MAG: DoxX family protein [Gemmatimonadota bacterium]PYP53185.1 MAG: DoxX family protein [Gemmatimonadota bacterium]